MAPLPHPRPHRLSLGPLESEILTLLWHHGATTAKGLHQQILADPDRELSYSSVMTVLKRLEAKGWLRCKRQDSRSFCWQPTVTQQEATQLQAYEHLKTFLNVGNPEVVAGFADHLDADSLEQLEAITQTLRQLRQQRGEP